MTKNKGYLNCARKLKKSKMDGGFTNDETLRTLNDDIWNNPSSNLVVYQNRLRTCTHVVNCITSLAKITAVGLFNHRI